MNNTNSMSATWKTIRIFISSTFRDMHAERDHLQSVVFPELEERLRQRRCHLEPVDLRLGVETASIAEEEAKELQVLKVCLSEIERSRPFLLVLLGDRYGWVPPADRMAAAAREAGLTIDVAGRSVTALEIEYSILKRHPDQRCRSRFYFREPLPYAQMPDDVAAQYSDENSPYPAVRADHAKLETFKQRLRDNGELRDRVRTYPAPWDQAHHRVGDLKAWGDQVREDLWKDLDEETRNFADKGELTWEQQERDTIEEFVETCARDFVGREEVTCKLLAVAKSPATENALWGACVVGPSGTGKSALFAHLHRQLTKLSLQHSNNPLFVVSHVAGISSQSVQVDSMLRRWIRELAEFLKVPFPIGERATVEETEQAFASLLSRCAAGHRVVVLMDALNQFEPTTRAQHLTWLPKLWPPNARLIATAIPGTESAALGQRTDVLIELLAPLSVSEAEAMALKVGQRYHREINRQVLAALLAKKLPDKALAAGNPLWLELALEELNLFDADDFARADREFAGTPEQRLLQMVLDEAAKLPADIEGLYGAMLERNEKVHGVAWARAFADLIAVSRFGWRELDFRILLPRLTFGVWDPLRFARLRRSFRAHVTQRGPQGQWDFFHAQMREAVRRKYRQDTTNKRALHSTVANYLRSLSEGDSLRTEELMFHLIGADLKLLAAKFCAEAPSECTATLAAHIAATQNQQPNPGLDWTLALLRMPNIDDNTRATLTGFYATALARALESRIRLSDRLQFLEATLTTAKALCEHDPSETRWQDYLATSYQSLGHVRYFQGNLSAALEAHQAALAVSERLAAAHPDDAELQDAVASNHNNVGHVLFAQGELTGALRACQSSLAIAERLAAADPSNAKAQNKIAHIQIGLAAVLIADGDLSKALRICEASLAIVEHLAVADPRNQELQRDLAMCHERLGHVVHAQGDLRRALRACEASLRIADRLAAADPENVQRQRDLSVSQNCLGDVLASYGDLTGALSVHEASLAIAERLAAADPGNGQWQRDLASSLGKVGRVRAMQDDLTGALLAGESSHAIFRRLSQDDPENTALQRDLDISRGLLQALAVSHDHAGGRLGAQGDFAGARRAHEVTHAIFGRLVEEDPDNAEWQLGFCNSCGTLAAELAAQGASVAASKMHATGNAIASRFAAAGPDNSQWQIALATSYYMGSGVAAEIGDVPLAIGRMVRCRETLRGMQARGMPLDGWARRMLERLEEMPG